VLTAALCRPVPGQGAAGEAEREECLLDLLAKARWPFPLRDDVVSLATSGDAGVQPPRLHLGGFLYHTGTDTVLTLPAGTPWILPFDGLWPVAGEPGRFRLTLRHRSGELEIGLRLSGGSVAPQGNRLDAVAPAAPADASEPVWLACAGREMSHLGYQRGPHLRLEFDGLEALLPPGAGKLAAWSLLWDVLLPRFRALSAGRTRDPGPDLRGRDGLAARRRLLREGDLPPAPRTRRCEDLPDLPQLGFLVADDAAGWRVSALQHAGFDAERFAAEDRTHRRLLDRLLAGLRWPLPAEPRGSTRALRPDDAWDRHGLQDHDGLDLGSLVWLEDGRLAGWPAATVLGTPHSAAKPYPTPPAAGRAWIVEVDDPPWRLRVLFFLHHVSISGEPALRPLDPKETLGGWRTSDPLLRCLGWPKGNHAHLEVVGIYRGHASRKRAFATGRFMPALCAAPASGPPADPLPLGIAVAPEDRPGVGMGLLLHGLAAGVPRLPGLVWRGGELELLHETRLPADGRWQRQPSGVRFRSQVAAGVALIVDLDGNTSPNELRLQPGRLRALFRLEGDSPLRATWPDLVDELLQPLLAGSSDR
jgi:hypothetical protein